MRWLRLWSPEFGVHLTSPSSSQWPPSASGSSSPISNPHLRLSSTPDTNTSWWSARCAAGWASFQHPAGKGCSSKAVWAVWTSLLLRQCSFPPFLSNRSVSTTWASPSLIPPQSSLKFSWWLCEYLPITNGFHELCDQSLMNPSAGEPEARLSFNQIKTSKVSLGVVTRFWGFPFRNGPTVKRLLYFLPSTNQHFLFLFCFCRSYIPEVRIMSIPNLRYMKVSVSFAWRLGATGWIRRWSDRVTVKLFAPPPPFSQESQVLLTLTNPVESVTHVTLAACEEEDPEAFNSTARVFKFNRSPWPTHAASAHLERFNFGSCEVFWSWFLLKVV